MGRYLGCQAFCLGPHQPVHAVHDCTHPQTVLLSFLSMSRTCFAAWGPDLAVCLSVSLSLCLSLALSRARLDLQTKRLPGDYLSPSTAGVQRSNRTHMLTECVQYILHTYIYIPHHHHRSWTRCGKLDGRSAVQHSLTFYFVFPSFFPSSMSAYISGRQMVVQRAECSPPPHVVGSYPLESSLGKM